MTPHAAPLLAAALVGTFAVQAIAERQPPQEQVAVDSASAPELPDAQQDAQGVEDAQGARRPVPFGVGERMEYDVRFGSIKAGSGSMEVRGIETVRGRPTYHTVFEVKGGIPFFRVHDVFASWMDTTTLSSLRFVQDQDEGPKERQRRYEIYPDRQVFTELVTGEGEEEPSVANPVDDGSFLYFIRTVPLEVGQTYAFDNYFRPDRNPVVIRVLRREQVKVPAGTFDAIVIQPSIKTKGIFSEKGRAEVWLSDDDRRMMLQMKSKLSFGSLNLYLTSYRPPAGAARSAGR
ncbi:MAG TPA: DUF3108 domain-containing protein [Gemmatimonadaceae bacterium]|nr:DUF3108 domain-containing protein [Gemmatimonadaceae bacterium]